ncbi:two-component histidine kinase sensor with PAS domains [Psychroflexus torquis ATCC 700755]|uniref:histidine kinase n=1 Tax=Psychroflexus torquis (strain ATCC 700755 / CIP 106069 / ACAM 623) TaxID=313595 RepID=K4ILC9_PSYTT|nr:HAMP domain-containing sensor histidine kinase [Psychroflexus torquis]AFU70583.1 two-component histidine kinase sensor with PAS domains [Psychroflexus torquis ATCC 700755]
MDIELLKKALIREKKARKEAESILEKKSLELYNANEQLKDALENTNLFSEQNPNAVMRFSKQTKDLIYANKQGKKISLFLNRSSNSKLKEKFIQELNFSFKKVGVYQFDLQFNNKTIRFFAIYILSKKYLNIYTADISDLKETEVQMQNITKRFKQAQRVAKMGSWELDLINNNMIWSEDLFYVLHVDSEKFIPSHENYVNLLHPDDHKLANEAFEKAINQKKGYILTQRRIFDDRKDLYIDCRGKVRLGKNGNVTRLYGICIDVTEKTESLKAKENFTKNLEIKVNERTQELKESLEREKELSILKSSFVAMASHEFRTPLTSISAASDVILKYFDKLGKEDITKRLIKIKNEVKDMTIMLEDILIIGKSDVQKLDYNPEVLDIIPLIKHIIFEYQLSESKSRNLTYKISLPSIMASVDKKWIKHVVVNLLSNALKYSEKNTPIEISMNKYKTRVVFGFKDYGIGISKKDIKLLFEPFHRGENVGEISGTGLGLSVLQKAVELHKGKIEVESEIKIGSNFKVTLPIT